MYAVDPDIGSSALRLWVASGSAALLVFVCALAFDWTRTRTVARISVVVVGAVLGATLAWAFLDAASIRDLSAERRSLETRAAEIGAQALAPTSPLACLDGLAGQNVEAACEKALFATPAAVAAASSYVAARLALLSDISAYTRRGGGNIESTLIPLQRALEADRFGFVAHTLAVRDGCSSDNCKTLALLHDASRVRANLSGQTLDRYLDHYVTAWGQAPDVPVADGTPAGAGPQNGAKKVVDVDFPSAASIPPVSIMNTEPKTGTAAAAAIAGEPTAPATPAASSRKSKKQAAAPAPAPVAPAPPMAAAPPVDPVWAPGAATPAAPQTAATASVPPKGVAPIPMQLGPVPEQPQASAAGAARTQ
jgi:hypothetical protein